MSVIITIPTLISDGGNLFFIRQKFCEFSGRYDLMTVEGLDNGADFFINTGQKFLDRMLDIDRLRARYTRNVSIGESLIRNLRSRVIQHVFLYDAAMDNKKELIKISYRQSSEVYPEDETLTEVGTPAYYTPYILRNAQSGSDEVAITSPVMDIVAGDEAIDAIRIYPPPADAAVIEIVGLFYSPTLVENNDRSFWSAQYPEMLIQASLLTLEKFMRNSEGTRDQLASLMMDIQQLDFDHVAQQIVDVDQMEG